MSTASGASDHKRTYLLVFGTLAVLTIVTVSAGYVNFPVGLGIGIALVIAAVKGSLVAAYFMHLLHEQKPIYWLLLLTLFLLFVMFTLMIGTALDQGGIPNVS
ncbi:MAG: cytochrome C oxidase subunit IV family protein [Candidatus Marinimicrobia bacterium]|nr:cytochrome C oxidase subunit IV family protein [Candidatus Neomarinimicrobiota bacterium]